jgi:hypothetical protein
MAAGIECDIGSAMRQMTARRFVDTDLQSDVAAHSSRIGVAEGDRSLAGPMMRMGLSAWGSAEQPRPSVVEGKMEIVGRMIPFADIVADPHTLAGSHRKMHIVAAHTSAPGLPTLSSA